MRDVRVAELAGTQFNRVSRAQLKALGLSSKAISHRVATGRLVIVEEGVFAVAPVLEDHWGRWMAATLTAVGTVLSHVSAAAAWGFWSSRRDFETVTRFGTGGPRRHGGLLVFRSVTVKRDRAALRGIPITSVPRTLLDLAAHVRPRSLARAVREALRLRLTTVGELVEYRAGHPPRRGSARLTRAVVRYAGLPIGRARSASEVEAMQILQQAGRPLPALDARIAREEADLSWPDQRLIIEIDGGPFHLDRGEDARKQSLWEAAGWTVRRLPSGDVYWAPDRLLALAPPPNVPRDPL